APSVGFCSASARSHAARSSSDMASAGSRYGLKTCHSPGLSVDMISSEREIRANFSMEINARLFPVPLHRAFRHVAHGGNFPERKAAEELQIDHLGECRLHFAKFVQHLADSRKFPVVDGVLHGVGVERSNLEQSPTLLGVPFPGLVNDKPRHPPRPIPH